MNKELKIIFAGTPEIAKIVLANMLNHGFKPQVILTQPDRPAGRGMKLTPSPVKVLAAEHNIEILQPVSFKKELLVLEQIRQLQPDIIVVAAYGLILPQQLLDIPRLGCVNVHVSLLPRWRGAAPIQRAVLAGDKESGVTIMRMDAGLDTGDILLQEKITMVEDETSGTLHAKLAHLGAKFLVEFLTNPESYPRIKQPEAGVNYAHKIDKEEAGIDWTEPALAIDRKIRGYNPFPGAFTFLAGQLHKIWQAKPIAAKTTTNQEPGTIIMAAKGQLWVAAGDNTILEIREIQEAGAKRKPIAVYLQGKPYLVGKKFEGGRNE